ncbi:MAG: site-specific integrase [Rhodospirillaceae bacterium]
MSRPRAKRDPLTKRAIDAAAPDPSGKVRLLWDGQVDGLALKITPTGSKVFVVQRGVDGKSRRITLGNYGDLTLDQARRQAGALGAQIASGADPVEEKRKAEAAAVEAERQAQIEAERRRREDITLAEFWPRYWSDAVEGANKPTTRVEKRRMWTTRIGPMLGKLPVRDISDGDISELIRSVLKFDSTGNVIRGRAEAANVYRLLRHLFNRALAWKVRPFAAGNPVKAFGAEPKVTRRERLLSDSEIAALLRELDRSWSAGAEMPTTCAAINLCVLMGFRAREAASLRHEAIRRDLGEIHLSDTKTGHSVRPLPPPALSVLDRLGHVTVGSPWVFPAPTDPSKPISYSALEKGAKRISKRAGVPRFHLHQLRHRFATVIANAEPNPRVGMALTGHKSYSAFIRYIHSDRERAKELAAKLGAVTAALGDLPAPSVATVMPLQSTRPAPVPSAKKRRAL